MPGSRLDAIGFVPPEGYARQFRNTLPSIVMVCTQMTMASAAFIRSCSTWMMTMKAAKTGCPLRLSLFFNDIKAATAQNHLPPQAVNWTSPARCASKLQRALQCCFRMTCVMRHWKSNKESNTWPGWSLLTHLRACDSVILWFMLVVEITQCLSEWKNLYIYLMYILQYHV